MKKKFREAEGYDADLQAAYDHYKAYSQGTADRFLAAFEEAIRIVRISPYVCRPRLHGWRQMVIVTYNQKDFVGSDRLGVRTIRPQDFIKETRI